MVTRLLLSSRTSADWALLRLRLAGSALLIGGSGTLALGRCFTVFTRLWSLRP